MRWFRKKYEIMWLKLAVYILSGRNVDRCEIISRRDNNGMGYASERVEAAIERIRDDYDSLDEYRY